MPCLRLRREDIPAYWAERVTALVRGNLLSLPKIMPMLPISINRLPPSECYISTAPPLSREHASVVTAGHEACHCGSALPRVTACVLGTGNLAGSDHTGGKGGGRRRRVARSKCCSIRLTRCHIWKSMTHQRQRAGVTVGPLQEVRCVIAVMRVKEFALRRRVITGCLPSVVVSVAFLSLLKMRLWVYGAQLIAPTHSQKHCCLRSLEEAKGSSADEAGRQSQAGAGCLTRVFSNEKGLLFNVTGRGERVLDVALSFSADSCLNSSFSP